MRFLVTFFLSLFLWLTHPVYAYENSLWQERAFASFIIHYAPPDSLNAAHAASILSGAHEEITFDLAMETTQIFHVYIMPSRKDFTNAIKEGLPKWFEKY